MAPYTRHSEGAATACSSFPLVWASRSPKANRACRECNRKKTKCDMQRPTCGLCRRVGTVCTFPLRHSSVRPHKISKALARSNLSRSTRSPFADIQQCEVPGNGMEIECALVQDRASEQVSSHSEAMANFRISTFISDTSTCNAQSSDDRHVASNAPRIPTADPLEQQPITYENPSNQELSTAFFPLSQVLDDPHASSMALDGPPNMATDSISDDWHLPPGVAEHLIDLFFERIHQWIPIFHRPRFYQKYLIKLGSRTSLVPRDSLSSEEELIFNCIFAFAARFSSSAHFQEKPPLERGAFFADRATAIYNDLVQAVEEPTLEYIKGCVLLTCYHFCEGSCHRGSLMTGIIIRLAYDIGLNRVDEDGDQEPGRPPDDGRSAVEEWIRKEELRQLWWVIWEMDTFGATISCQPYSLDRRRVQVQLPVSTKHWFSGTPVKSATLGSQLGSVWKALKGSPNQDERAWFLISNYLMACAHDAERRPISISSEEMAELEYALGCFNLALPARFHLCTFFFDDEEFAKSNYILSTQLMVQTARVCLEKAKEAKAQQCGSLSAEYRNDEFKKKVASELVRIAHAWSPGRISLNHPIMCCTLLGPGALFVQNDEFTQQSQEVSELFLSHCSKYWHLGKMMLRLLGIIKLDAESSQDVAVSKEKELVRRFSLLIPPCRKRRCSIASRDDPDPRLADSTILNASLDFNQNISSAIENLPVVDLETCVDGAKDGNFEFRARPQNEGHVVSSYALAHSDSDKRQHNLFDNAFDDIGQYVSGDSPEFSNSFPHIVSGPGHVEDDWML